MCAHVSNALCMSEKYPSAHARLCNRINARIIKWVQAGRRADGRTDGRTVVLVLFCSLLYIYGTYIDGLETMTRTRPQMVWFIVVNELVCTILFT